MGRCVGGLIPNDDPQRLGKVLNEKMRTIGVDRLALDEQVAGKARRVAEEKAKDRIYAQQVQQQDTLRAAAEAATLAARQEAAQRTLQYQQTQQGASKAREKDLQEPAASWAPARVGDADPRNGPASLQRFVGEDLAHDSRHQQQCLANRMLWKEQQASHATAATALAADERNTALMGQRQDALRQKLVAEQEALRKLSARQTARDNNTEAAKHASALKVEEAARKLADASEVAFTAHKLNEDPAIGVSAADAHRVRPDHWKGMSEQQLRAITAAQATQTIEHNCRLQANRREDLQYAKHMEAVAHAAELQHRQVQAAEEVQRRSTAAHQRTQVQEKALRDAELTKLYNNNLPSPEYFQQFGTSHR